MQGTMPCGFVSIVSIRQFPFGVAGAPLPASSLIFAFAGLIRAHVVQVESPQGNRMAAQPSQIARILSRHGSRFFQSAAFSHRFTGRVPSSFHSRISPQRSEPCVAGNSVGRVVVFMLLNFGLRFPGFGGSHLPPLSSCTWPFALRTKVVRTFHAWAFQPARISARISLSHTLAGSQSPMFTS